MRPEGGDRVGAGLRLAPSFSLQVSHYMPADHGTHRDFIAPWARAVEEASNGEIGVTVHDGASPLGLLANQYQQVLSGIVDVAHSPAHLPAGRFPLSQIVGMPFLAASAQSGTQLLWRLLPRFLEAEFQPLKVLALHADSGGALHTREGPIERLADLRGLRIRTPNALVGAVIERLGGIPVPLAPPQIGAALRAGAIDGAAMPWDVVVYTGAIDHFRHHLDTRLYVAPLYFVMNGASYRRLPGHLRQAVDAVSGEALVAKFGAWWQAWERPGIDEARRRGHVINHLDAAERARWQAMAEPAITAWLDSLEAQGNNDAAAIYRAARKFVDAD